jgi:hypothetical protein
MGLLLLLLLLLEAAFELEAPSMVWRHSWRYQSAKKGKTEE